MYKHSSNLMAIIDAYRMQDKSYFNILERLSQDARPIVFGEEDNPEL
jgi:hypothetical protein